MASIMARNKSEAGGSGIYAIYCHANGKAYIGSSKRMCARLARHRFDLRNDQHGNQHLQNAWNLYGESEFSMGVVQVCDAHALLATEQVWLDVWMCAGLAFNRHRRAESPVGTKWTDEEKKAASDRMKANPTFKGRKHSDRSRELLSARAKERLSSPERNPFFGKSHSEETKARLSAANKGNKYCLGRRVSDKCRKAVAESNKRRALERKSSGSL